LAILALGCGCFSPRFHNGDTKCSIDGKCPSGYHCAADNTCWQLGQNPTPVTGPDSFPPAPVWISAGGGSGSTTASEVNLSIGGTSPGMVISASGSTLTTNYIGADND
jgi:hypothetical protein